MQRDKNAELKFYLRGVATGAAVAAAVMGIAFYGQPKEGGDGSPSGQTTVIENTEDTLEAKASEGSEATQATEPSESSEATQATEPSESSEATQATEPSESSEASQATEPSESSEASQATEPSESSEATQATEPSESSEASQATEPSESVTITIVRGSSSYTAARLLAEAGMVESAKDYDAYLCRNGYDKKISVGTFVIPAGSTEEEIALIITGGR